MATSTMVNHRTSSLHYLSLLISSILLTLFLFFLDEGHYNFNWMSNAGNWIPFVLYVVVLYFAQFLVSKYAFKAIIGIQKTILSILGGGVLLALIIVIVGMFNSW